MLGPVDEASFSVFLVYMNDIAKILSNSRHKADKSTEKEGKEPTAEAN